MFDWRKPTVQMLGRWQPWHDGHQELFKRAIKKTGQVIIQVRDVHDAQDPNNPFDWNKVCGNIEEGLKKDGYKKGVDYEIMLVPNIVNITYGRRVGYLIEEESFSKDIEAISATKIRSTSGRKNEL